VICQLPDVGLAPNMNLVPNGIREGLGQPSHTATIWQIESSVMDQRVEATLHRTARATASCGQTRRRAAVDRTIHLDLEAVPVAQGLRLENPGRSAEPAARRSCRALEVSTLS